MSIKSKILRELEKKPRTMKELKNKLGNDKKVARTVDELRRDNRVQRTKGGYALTTPEGETVPCTLVKLAAGFGFARPDDGSDDIFIPGRALNGAMPGDGIRVERVESAKGDHRTEGRVTAVTRPRTGFVGTVRAEGGRLYLAPDDCPAVSIAIKKSAAGGARDGEKAAIVMLERGETHEDHRAGVAMRFGSSAQARHCAQAILYAAGMDRRFPEKVKAEAKDLPSAVSEKECRGREDHF